MSSLHLLRLSIIDVINNSGFLDQSVGTDNYNVLTKDLKAKILTMHEQIIVLNNLGMFDIKVPCIAEKNPEGPSHCAVKFKNNLVFRIDNIGSVSIDDIIEFGKKYVKTIADADTEKCEFYFTRGNSGWQTLIHLKGLGVIGSGDFTLKDPFLTNEDK